MIDVIDYPACVGSEAAIGLIAAHATGGAQFVLQHPPLNVETVHIGVAMGPLEPHRQLPALTGTQRRQWLALQLLDRGLVPAERDSGWHDGVRGEHFFDGKRKAHALRIGLRQFVDDANQFDVAAFPFGGENLRHACVGA